MHRFPAPDHIELELTDAEAGAEWFDEFMDQWLSDQSDDGYERALAEVEQHERELRGLSRCNDIIAKERDARKLERHSERTAA